ncbi:putative Averantin oxidoreductase [Acephala macrosclerotiorum]|nr:putative Averantin oxidoreductase [Acephala macrosclerotiorum]
MAQGEIEMNAVLLIGAGSETTATFLSGITYHLLLNPHILIKLTTLIRTTFPTSSSITIRSASTLPYLPACIEEGLRLYPPLPAGMPHHTNPGGNAICGEFVPGNTVVSVHHWPANISERNFKDAKKFVPERWLRDEERPKRYADDKRGACQAFSMGPRNCLGRNLAYAEMRLILAKMLWNFDLELQDDILDWSNQKVWLLWEKGPLHVKLIPRNFA